MSHKFFINYVNVDSLRLYCNYLYCYCRSFAAILSLRYTYVCIYNGFVVQTYK